MKTNIEDVINLAMLTVKIKKFYEEGSINEKTILELDKEIYNGLKYSFKQAGISEDKAEIATASIMTEFDSHPARLSALEKGKLGNEARIKNALLRIASRVLKDEVRRNVVDKYRRSKGF